MKRRSCKNYDFVKKCKCLTHDLWTSLVNVADRKEAPVDILKSKIFKKAHIKDLRGRGLLSEKANFICTGCYNKAFEAIDDAEIQLTKKRKLEDIETDSEVNGFIYSKVFTFLYFDDYFFFKDFLKSINIVLSLSKFNH